MKRRILTDRFLKSVKPAAKGKRDYYPDAVVPNLYARVTDTGTVAFAIIRRVNGKQTQLTLGDYPAIELDKARDKARPALQEMERGHVPKQIEKVKAGVQRSDSFEGAVENYIKRDVEKNRKERTQEEIIRPLRKRYIPKWGSLPLADIEPRQIIEALDELIDAGSPVQANRDRSILHKFFKWCMGRQLIRINPVAAVAKPTKETARDRVLDDDELREVWKHTESLGWPFGHYIRSLILTGQRRSEVSLMTRAEIDAKQRLWTIPKERVKNGREHAVPITPAFQTLLDGAKRYKDQDDDAPIFTGNGSAPVSGFSDAKEDLDASLKAAGVKLKPWTLHDLRRSVGTGMGRIGIQPHIIEAALNHRSGFRSGIAAVYQHQSYLPERRAAFAQWAKHIETLTGEISPTDNVVELATAR